MTWRFRDLIHLPFSTHQKIAPRPRFYAFDRPANSDLEFLDVPSDGKRYMYQCHGSYRILKVNVALNECWYLQYLLGGSSQFVSVYRITSIDNVMNCGHLEGGGTEHGL